MADSYVDVLIIGAGPAGYMAAAWLARAGVGNVKLVDKRPEKVSTGHADGLRQRTLEVFQSFALADRVLKEGNTTVETCFWEPDANGIIYRSGRSPSTIPGISRFQSMTSNQGRIESWFEDAIQTWSHDSLSVTRPWLPHSLKIDQSIIKHEEKYPITVTMHKVTENQNKHGQPEDTTESNAHYRTITHKGYEDNMNPEFTDMENVHAKYVIGCDGAHSWVRKQIGIEMEGDSTDYIWGVLNAVPITNFPDIRSRCSIHSVDSGSIMVIPRENGLVRLYIQLKEIPHISGQSMTNSSPKSMKFNDTRLDKSSVTPEMILNCARKILAPYTIDITDLTWYTAYQIGQRIAPSFQYANRIFIAGDACHTHSPKAGQGMNVSMMDTFNLGWKLAYVLKGLATSKLLTTYELERKLVARQLIDFDHKLSRLYSGRPSTTLKDDGVSLDEFKQFFIKDCEFGSGTTVDYPGSLIIKKPEQDADTENQYVSPLATGCPIGRRFYDAQIIMQSDGMTYFLNDRMPSDGRWRVIYFAGDLTGSSNSKPLYRFMEEFGDYLVTGDTFVDRYTPAYAKKDSVIDILLVHASERTSLEWNQFPEAFRPRDTKKRMNYWKIYVDGESPNKGHGHAYKTYGIDKNIGALVVLRPDGYVASVEEPSKKGILAIDDFFSKFLLQQKVLGVPNHRSPASKDRYGPSNNDIPILAV